MVVVAGNDTPVYRSMIDDTLLQMLQGQLIDLKMYLQSTTMPFADKLLESINAQEQAAAAGNVAVPGADDPLAIEAAKANSMVMSKLNAAMTGGAAA